MSPVFGFAFLGWLILTIVGSLVTASFHRHFDSRFAFPHALGYAALGATVLFVVLYFERWRKPPAGKLAASILFLLLLVSGQSHAQDQTGFPEQPRAWMVNEDGSCVQCSIGMCGVWQNCPQASTLLWNSPYGAAVRGGSYPSRVESYSDKRGIPCYNVTGQGTFEWMKWGAKTGRLCAIGCFSSHFQTLLWYNPDPADQRPWKVSNNWQGICGKNFEYTEEEFRHYHLASGQWVVILKTPPPPPHGAQYVKWW